MGFGTVITAMVTPFTDDLEVDFDKASFLAQKVVNDGSDGILISGTTGESPNLTADEKIKLLDTVLGTIGDKVPVMMGTGSNSTKATIQLSQKAEAAGAKGLLLVTPYYNRPNQEGLYRHFKAIAETTSLPIMLYNVPGRTGVNLLPETVIRLSEVPNIKAIKEASGNLDQVGEIILNAPDGFEVYSGDDSLTLPIISVGGKGIVSVASHIVARQIQQMIEAYLAGRVKEAKQIHLTLLPLFKVLFITTNPIPVKAALKIAGVDVGALRPPLIEADPKERNAIETVMRSLGIRNIE